MPLLTRSRERKEIMQRPRDLAMNSETTGAMAPPGLFSTCANPNCRSSWLRVWRSRSGPVFEGGWCCSAECTSALLAAALKRERDVIQRVDGVHRHRLPLGLVMLEQGWITQGQLRRALEAQRAARRGRLGYWLTQREGIREDLVTKALALQWSCPVLPLEARVEEALAVYVPRLFVDAFGALPLCLAASKGLYLGFEERLDPALALAVERMTGMRVESGLVPESRFRLEHARMLEYRYPRLELIEATSESALVQVLTRRLERTGPGESRLVRVHDCFWLRLWNKPQRGMARDSGVVQDVICSLRSD